MIPNPLGHEGIAELKPSLGDPVVKINSVSTFQIPACLGKITKTASRIYGLASSSQRHEVQSPDLQCRVIYIRDD